MNNMIEKALKWGSTARAVFSTPQAVLHNLRGANQILECDRAELAGEVQRLRDALEGVRRIIQSAALYSEIADYKPVLTSAVWACSEALSPQSEKVSE